MNDIYQTNAPEVFPVPQEQPTLKEDSLEGGVLKNLPVKETVDRWKKEVLDRIQYLRENLEQANQEKESLSQEVEQLQSELSASQGRIKELEAELSGTLDTFNILLNEVSQALES